MKKIIVAGYGSSGSSAVIDFLYDSGLIKGFWMEYPSESRVLNHSLVLKFKRLLILNSINKIKVADLVFIISGGRVFKGLVSEPALMNDVLGNLSSIVRDDLYYSRINEISKHEHIVIRDSKNHFDLLTEKDISKLLSRQLKVSEININELEKYYCIILKILIEGFEKKTGNYLLFNNDAHLYNNDSLMDLSSFIKILVFRNPLDMYTRKQFIHGYNNLNPIKKIKRILFFSYSFNKKMVKSLINKKKNGYILIQFEDFLTNERTRNRLIEHIGMEYNCNVINQKFKIDYSLMQIGVSRSGLDFFSKIFLSLTSIPAYLIVSCIKFSG